MQKMDLKVEEVSREELDFLLSTLLRAANHIKKVLDLLTGKTGR